MQCYNAVQVQLFNCSFFYCIASTLTLVLISVAADWQHTYVECNIEMAAAMMGNPFRPSFIIPHAQLGLHQLTTPR